MTDDHRRLRELLGAHASGTLPPDEQVALQEHLDRCASCRAELAEIEPVVEHLRRTATRSTGGPAVPPPDLGERIARRIAAERSALPDVGRRRAARSSRLPQRLGIAAAAALVLTGAVALGTVLGDGSGPRPVAAPSAPPTPRIPLETVPLVSAAGLRTGDASVIAHSWGVEARFTGSGFVDGERYRAAFRAQDGRVLPAGEFLGTGGRTLTCNMQSALPRAAAAAFVVLDAAGRTVLTAQLPT